MVLLGFDHECHTSAKLAGVASLMKHVTASAFIFAEHLDGRAGQGSFKPRAIDHAPALAIADDANAVAFGCEECGEIEGFVHENSDCAAGDVGLVHAFADTAVEIVFPDEHACKVEKFDAAGRKGAGDGVGIDAQFVRRNGGWKGNRFAEIAGVRAANAWAREGFEVCGVEFVGE